MTTDVVIPEISENVTSGKVVAVLVAVGDSVRADDVIVELETEKTVVEIPSPVDGRIAEVLVSEGDEKHVGDVIARIDSEAEEAADAQSAEDTPAASPSSVAEGDPSEAQAPDPAAVDDEANEQPVTPEKTSRRMDADAPDRSTDDKGPPQPPSTPADRDEQQKEKAPATPVPASPSVRRLARELGADIHRVAGSGPGGRITPDDIKGHIRRQKPDDAAPDTVGPASPGGIEEGPLPEFSQWGAIERVGLQTVRRLTAQSTHASWRRIPHVTQFDRADITAVEAFIDRHGERVRSAGGKLTVTAILMNICAAALKRFPRFNASIDMAEDQLIFKHYVNIGLAVDTPHGLLVPVVRDADQKSITELAKAIADLAARGRERKLKPEETEGGTFTISNQGGIGGTAFTPIVLWPQAAILGVSRSSTEPVFVDGGFEPRTILPLSLSYDHRIIDGADAARFLRWICDSLAQPLTMALD